LWRNERQELPLKLVIYADEEGKTFVAYDSFVSLLAQYQREEINQVAQVVAQKLEALTTEASLHVFREKDRASG
jgi:uncharacterized protein (DUF302 family)